MKTIKSLASLVLVAIVSFSICASIALGVVLLTERFEWVFPISVFGSMIMCNAVNAFRHR